MHGFIQRNKNNMTENQVNELKEYLSANDYDSDAVKDDFHPLISTSNIYNNIKNRVCCHLIASYIRNVQCMLSFI